MSTEDALRAEVDAARWRESQAEQRETATIDERDEARRERDALRADYQAAQVTNAPLKRQLAEIRAVVAEVDAIHPLDFRGIPSVGSVVDRMRAILDREPGREEPASEPLPTEPICLGCGVDNCEHVEATTLPARAEQLVRDLLAAGELAKNLQRTGVIDDGETVWSRWVATRLIKSGWTKETEK